MKDRSGRRPPDGPFTALLRKTHPDLVAAVEQEGSRAPKPRPPRPQVRPASPASPAAATQVMAEAKTGTATPRRRPAVREPDPFFDEPTAPRRAPETKSAATAYDGLEGGDCLRRVEQAIAQHAFDVEDAYPMSVAPEIAAVIDARIAAGARLLAERPGSDLDGYVVGFDFGTSSTKIVVHQPFTAADPSAALPVFAPLRSAGVEHLWRTAMWRDPEDDRVRLYPTGGARPLHGFKAGLIAASGVGRSGDGPAYSHAAAAYLALMTAYVVGWMTQTRPLGAVGGPAPQRVHVGVPVESRDDPRTGALFTRVLNAAAALAPFADRLTCADARDAFSDAGPVEGLDALLVAYGELEGVVMGYLSSPDARPGAHMVVDVGASTLDIAAFHLRRHDERDIAEVHSARVKLLGAEAWRWAQAERVPSAVFRRACTHVWDDCFSRAKPFDPAFDRTLHDAAIPVLFIGGGRRTSMHADLYQGTKAHLGRRAATPVLSAALTQDPSTEPERLLLAFGLSRHESMMPECRLPSSRTPSLPVRRDFTDRNPTPDV